MSGQRLHSSATIRFLLWGCGVLALVLGVIGVFLPGLPTTPFVLLAGACFVRASPHAHAWLLANRTFGPMLRKWEDEHALSRRVKVFAITMMLLTASASAWYFAGQAWIQAMIIAGAIAGGVTVALIPSRD